MSRIVSGISLFLIVGCHSSPRTGERIERRGDEIAVCGRLFRTGAPVILWTDPGGYDAYRVEKRFGPVADSAWEKFHAKSKEPSSPNRYGLRAEGLTPEELERVRGGGWDLPLLQRMVDQFVIHFDVCGTSRECFRVLHDERGLSVHFLLDIDGTIYQTLDLKERAWHATTSNTRSVGIEIAQIGAYEEGKTGPLDRWYRRDSEGRMRIVLPESFGDGGVRTPGFVGRPARPDPITGVIQGTKLRQYDFTPEQYDSLIKLTAGLCRIFPRIRCDYPRDASGGVLPHKLADSDLRSYEGVLGHYHVQTDKTDPGPAFQWDLVIDGARRLLAEDATK